MALVRRMFPVVLLTAAFTLGACGGGGNAGKPSTGPMGNTVSTKPVSGADLDKAFIQGTVPHHQAAIDMANVEVQKGTNEQVKSVARSIITAQQAEIADLNNIGRDLFKLTPARTMSGPMGNMMGVPLSTDPSKMAGELSAAPRTDVAFLQMMIPHHASVITMAQEELKNGRDARLKTMSQSVIDTQAKEIGQMQALLKQLA